MNTTTLADTIRSLRLDLNYTQAEMAAKAGLSPSHFANIERGERALSLSALISIAEAIGCKASTLLALADL
jgi:transcriptional regulator with XRE-family HTH domain